MEIKNLYNKLSINQVINSINGYNGDTINLMEICGTHTAAIYKNGIDRILPKNIKLISGPGCPVCVTPQNYIDLAISLSKNKDNIIISFGDLLRVKGTASSLYEEKAKGACIHIVYSVLDAIDISINNTDKEVIFLAVGFETTIATYSVLVEQSLERGVRNLSLLTSLKTIPKTIEHLLCDTDIKIDGYIAPGHVATITGCRELDKLSYKYQKPSVVTGFKGEEILVSIYKLLEMIDKSDNRCINLYKYGVRDDGNNKAKEKIDRYFETSDAEFRGLGVIKDAAIVIRDEYSRFDATKRFKLEYPKENKIEGCICGDILKGIKNPSECMLFNKVCNPYNPIGPCMVSSEGNCSNYYKYKL